MSKPARLAAALCSAAVLFACTIKKAEVAPDAERDTTAISTPEPASPTPTVVTPAGKPGKRSLIDRLYPNQPIAAAGKHTLKLA